MAIVMDALVAAPAPTTGYDFLASVRYGSGWDPWASLDGGPMTFDAGSASDPGAVGGWTTWDDSPDDGTDSAWVDVALTFQKTSGGSEITWSVDGQSVTYDASSFNVISKIAIVADSSAQALISWQNVAVKFFQGGQQADSYISGSGPTVDETANTDPTEQADILTITPQASNIDKVTITAQVRLASPEGVYLDANSVFGQVLITTA